MQKRNTADAAPIYSRDDERCYLACNIVTLREIIHNLETISDDLVIFATKLDENWLLDGPAALILEEDMDNLGVTLEDLT